MRCADKTVRDLVKVMIDRLFAQPKSAWALANNVTKGAAETSQTVPSRLKGDLDNAKVAVAKERFGPLDPAGEQIAMRRNSERIAKAPGEMGLGDATDARQSTNRPMLVRGRVHAIFCSEQTADQPRIARRRDRFHHSLPAGWSNREPPFASACAMDTAQRGNIAVLKRCQQLVNFAATKVDIAFVREAADGSDDNPSGDLHRCAASLIGNYAALFMDGLPPFIFHRPVERQIGVGKIGGRLRNCSSVEPFAIGKRMPDADPLEPLVKIARVSNNRNRRSRANVRQLAAAPAKQWPNQLHVGPRSDRLRSNASKAPDAGPSRKAHQHSFGLVIRMMSGRNCAQSALLSPIAEQTVPLVAGALLNCCLRHLGPAGGQGRMRNSEAIAKRLDQRRFITCFGPKPMIDGCSLDPSRPGSGNEQKKSKAIRAARNRRSNARFRRDQRVETCTKALDRLRIWQQRPFIHPTGPRLVNDLCFIVFGSKGKGSQPRSPEQRMLPPELPAAQWHCASALPSTSSFFRSGRTFAP